MYTNHSDICTNWLISHIELIFIHLWNYWNKKIFWGWYVNTCMFELNEKIRYVTWCYHLYISYFCMKYVRSTNTQRVECYWIEFWGLPLRIISIWYWKVQFYLNLFFCSIILFIVELYTEALQVSILNILVSWDLRM